VRSGRNNNPAVRAGGAFGAPIRSEKGWVMETMTAMASRLLISVALVALAACTSFPMREHPIEPTPAPSRPMARPAPTHEVHAPAPAPKAAAAVPEIYPGTGAFIAPAAPRATSAAEETAGGVTLNFKDADLREVVKTILGDILKQNYSIDSQVKGQVSIQTSRPIARDALIPTLEVLLRMHGAVLTREQGIYRIGPESGALSGSIGGRQQLANTPGYQVVAVPLRYIAAKEMQKLLEMVKPGKGAIHADTARNLLILSGSRPELQNMLDSVSVFDVDQMRGMSVGLFRLQSAEPRLVQEELGKIFGDSSDGLLSGMVKVIPVERLNALLVITPQRKYLEEAGRWIQRLDQAGDAAGQGLFVYYVQNGKAGHLAEILNQLFSSEKRRERQPGPVPSAAVAAPGPKGPSGAAVTGPAPATKGPAMGSAVDVGDVRIIADEENNALLVMASPADYRKVESALRRLDIVPQQVLVQASIIEVELTGDLSYGVEWFFTNKLGSNSGIGTLDLGKAGLAAITPGFSYQVVDGAGAVQAVLNTLASETALKVVSSPSLMVLDNRTARIRVGDQVPVRTSETTNTATSGSNPLIVSTIQFRDTGVLLEVTPRVNAGGMVVLDISQEVSNVDKTTSSSIDSPTINQRQISTSVAVHSGDTIVLGGLIRDNDSDSNSGIPGLRKLPVIGGLFGSTSTSSERTELLVLITPTAVPDQQTAREVTAELRSKMKALDKPLRRVGSTMGAP